MSSGRCTKRIKAAFFTGSTIFAYLGDSPQCELEEGHEGLHKNTLRMVAWGDSWCEDESVISVVTVVKKENES